MCELPCVVGADRIGSPAMGTNGINDAGALSSGFTYCLTGGARAHA
jgi:hypothetical protein